MIKYLVIGFILLSVNITAVALPTAKLILKVIDEAGIPVEGADANLIFILPGNSLSTKTIVKKGLTDSNGLFAGRGESSQYIPYGAVKNGYYKTGGEIRMEKSIGVIGFRYWEPSNTTVELVLKKKLNPIPLYAYRMDLLLAKDLLEPPILNGFIGYDLIARDWVAPYGQGTHRDFLFKLEKYRATSRRDHHVVLILKFSNEGDGIQSYYAQPNKGSVLRLPYHAPATGYLTRLVIKRERSTDKRSSPENMRNRVDQNYFFRVRTEKDEQGNVVSALYGKIHGGIGLFDFYSKIVTGKIKFNYYLNPTPNDTNLEFDTRKNLFTDLTSQEEVVLP